MNNPKAVIGTNSWGSAAYEKIIRGSAVDNDTLKEAMKMSVKANLLFVDSARDYGFGKGPKLIGMCCPDEVKISSKYTPFTKFKPGQVRESVDRDLKDFGRTSIEVYWLHMPNDISQYMEELLYCQRENNRTTQMAIRVDLRYIANLKFCRISAALQIGICGEIS